ncbi:MAG: alpha-galactosidase [Lachnospiraceae bacterium]|nr:alpha-galactosidase [Lachnospiraceae bacterium]
MMIDFNDNIFRLSTKKTSYWFQITAFGHLEHIYYGKAIPNDQPACPLVHKRTAELGSSVMYKGNAEADFYCLDTMCLEWSGIGKGDYRHTPAEIKMPDGTFTADFIYQSHVITDGTVKMETLPGAYGKESDSIKTLTITMLDESNSVKLLLSYTVFYDTNVITRRTVLINENKTSLTIRKLMSLSLDLANDNFRLVTFNGGWIKEAHKNERPLSYGIHLNSSTTGASSNRNNPGFLLASAKACENHGHVYGFNLIYSGNHYSAIELSGHNLVRVQTGINPYCFEWTLAENEKFETPEAFFTFSPDGFNGLSHNFHDFINAHIVRGDWQGRERPVLINNWEAFFFKFTQNKLLKLAKRAKNAGIELFVLDDGWFGKRDNDKSGLGDYQVNKKKFPRGLKAFSSAIKGMGLKFGLWFEPEMINEDSLLYRSNPEYALTTPGKTAAQGRNQLVLDLANRKVRDYIVDNVTAILDSCDVDYVKWDFNRHLSDACSQTLENQGRFFHSYILGLYEVLGRIFTERPHILLETCSSGGNRFDAGMLCYSPQIWASDNTDPIERLFIQGGLSYLYPLSTIGTHVSEAPHQQTLRDTPLATRYNVSCFGCLGYELDLKYLSRLEIKEIKEQIAFYKDYRRIFQYGRFYRNAPDKDNKVVWNVAEASGEILLTGFFQTQAKASEGFDRLKLLGVTASEKYLLTTRPQSLFIKRFGGLVKHILPITLNPDGFILRLVNKFYSLNDCAEEYEAYGEVLAEGILLNNQFGGTHYNKNTRLLGDFGSNLYLTRRKDGKKF